MTTAYYIHGKKSTETIKEPKKPFFNYAEMTEGQLRLSLVARQYELLGYAEQSPDKIAASRLIKTKIESAIAGKQTMHTNTQLERYIANVSRLDYPATAGYIMSKLGRNDTRIGNNEFIDWYLENQDLCQEIKNEWSNTSWIRFRRRQELRNEWQTCFSRVEYVRMINQKFEKSGHHLLYNYAGAGMPTAVETKKVLHKIAIENYVRVLGLSPENVQLWLRNGIIAENMRAGAGARIPEGTILYMKEHIPAIGGPPAVIPIILAIVKAALLVTVTILQQMRAEDRIKMQANAQGLGTEAFGPEKTDFEQAAQQAVQSGAIIPAAIAAYLLLSR